VTQRRWLRRTTTSASPAISPHHANSSSSDELGQRVQPTCGTPRPRPLAHQDAWTCRTGPGIFARREHARASEVPRCPAPAPSAALSTSSRSATSTRRRTRASSTTSSAGSSPGATPYRSTSAAGAWPTCTGPPTSSSGSTWRSSCSSRGWPPTSCVPAWSRRPRPPRRSVIRMSCGCSAPARSTVPPSSSWNGSTAPISSNTYASIAAAHARS
jgi:hypothetical protein